jgi:3-oxoacyl-[acyl-carrier-protein] synthase II
MSSNRRVVITGIGVVTPIGTGRDEFWQGLQGEVSQVGPITRFDPSPFRSRIAGQVADFRPADFIEARRVRRFDRFAQFGVAATRLAVADAHLDISREDADRIGSTMGTALGGVARAEEEHGNYMRGGLREVDPALALAVFPGAASCNIAIEFGVTGPNTTNGMSCASGTMAIGDGFRSIMRGEADVMLSGGTEAPLSPLCFGAFAVIRAMSTRNDEPSRASRPFDRERDGFVMAEGAAVLVLEERERAISRGAPIYAELCGYGVTNDAHHMTQPRPDGTQAARAMRLALEEAHIGASEVGYINAHGSSTPLNDPTETGAIHQVFGDYAARIPVSGTKGYYGHALGASGAFEAAICALASQQRWLPPTVNLVTPDPACDLSYIAGKGEKADPEYMISNSFGFGGINAVLVFRRHDGR